MSTHNLQPEKHLGQQDSFCDVVSGVGGIGSGEKADTNQAEIDHIVPRSKGGSNHNSNLRVVSKKENLLKGNR